MASKETPEINIFDLLGTPLSNADLILLLDHISNGRPTMAELNKISLKLPVEKFGIMCISRLPVRLLDGSWIGLLEALDARVAASRDILWLSTAIHSVIYQIELRQETREVRRRIRRVLRQRVSSLLQQPTT